MAKRNRPTEFIPTQKMYHAVEDMVSMYSSQRSLFERKWYDNNFFDDGLHFRYLSKQTGKIVDQSIGASIISPKRAIPKASRQIRGIANLLLALEPHPAIYPERVSAASYPPAIINGQLAPNPAYEQALQQAKDIAKKKGHWLEEEWAKQELPDKLIEMIILTCKHNVSYLQIYPDHVKEEIRTKVRDAFEVYVMGNLKNIYDSPSIHIAVPVLISEIKANEQFDEKERFAINADNRYASSEIKQAYKQSRLGSGKVQDHQATVIQKESYIKEYIDENNLPGIKASENGDAVLKGKNKGDMVIRQTFTTSNGTLRDEYVDLPEYPLVDYRLEPGPIYGVPLIERFMSANKSLDIVMSRLEGYTNTMVTGIYQKRKGENFRVANIPGGQMIEYEATPLTQMNISPIPAFLFQFIGLLEKNIEEQGASTAALGQLPEGVKSGKAIESVKATEYANLKIATDMFKGTVKRISERMFDIAGDYFVTPQEVSLLENGEPTYFDVIGEAALEARKKAGLEIPADAILLKKDTRVRIEIESGLGYTVQGKKETMQQISNYMLQLAEVGMVSKAAIQTMLEKFLEIFQFGATQEFMDALDNAEEDTLTDEQISQMKIAILEVLKDVGLVGQEAEQRQIDASKLGVLEVAKDLQ